MTDKIEKTTILKAPLENVWNAIGDSQAFGTWFGMKIEGPFRAGETVQCTMHMTEVDEAVAAQQKPHVGMRFEMEIVRIEVLKHLSFRWQPGSEPQPGGPTTLVTFDIEEAENGTRLTITESGFDALPLERRAKAFADNEGGWQAQLSLVTKYLERGTSAHGA